MTRRGALLVAVLVVVATTVGLALLGGDGSGGAEELDPLAPSGTELLVSVGAVLLTLLLSYLVVRLLACRR